MRNILQFIFITSLIVFSLPVSAQTKETGDPIDLNITSIYASRSNEGVDTSLAYLRKKLELGFSDYSTFKKLGTSAMHLTVGASSSSRVPNGNTATVTYLEGAGKFVKLQFEITRKISTTFRISRGSTVFQAGLPYKDGILILAISVK